MKNNNPLAIIGGLIAALVGAAIWAAITVETGYQIGYMAVGVGFLVGFAVRIFGKGTTQAFGIIGAVLAFGPNGAAIRLRWGKQNSREVER